jgi:hypothetical protein
MDLIVSELEGSWLRFLVSIPLDVLVFLTVFYLSASLSFYVLRTHRRIASASSLISSTLAFGFYYLYPRTRLLDLHFSAFLMGMSLFMILLLITAMLAPNRRRALKLLKLLAVAKTRRVLECVIAFVTLVVFLPLMVLIAVLVKLTSRGPILKRRPSSSHSGRSITLYSFRTKIPIYDYSIGSFYMSSEKDWRFTPFGRFLDRSSLDLLPRLINVLNGDLHLVGLTPLNTELLLTKFSKELLETEYDLVGRLYDVTDGETFPKMIDYCIPTGVITYSDLNAYQLKPSRRTVVKLLDKRPRLRKEAHYFLSTAFPSLRLLIMVFGKVVLRLLITVNLLRLEEVRDD